MINTRIWNKILSLTLIAFRQYRTKQCSKYLPFLYIFTLKYGVFEQASRTVKVVFGYLREFI